MRSEWNECEELCARVETPFHLPVNLGTPGHPLPPLVYRAPGVV